MLGVLDLTYAGAVGATIANGTAATNAYDASGFSKGFLFDSDSTSQNAQIIRNNTGLTVLDTPLILKSNLTINNTTATNALVLAGVIKEVDGSRGVEIVGATGGIVEMAAANTYTGTTEIKSGTLALVSRQLNTRTADFTASNSTTTYRTYGDLASQNIVVYSNATFDVSNIAVETTINSTTGKVAAYPFHIKGSKDSLNDDWYYLADKTFKDNLSDSYYQTLSGDGIVKGLVIADTGSHLAPFKTNGSGFGTLTFENDLTLSNGAILDYSFGEMTGLIGPSDMIDVKGDLTFIDTVTLTTKSSFAEGSYVYEIFSYVVDKTDFVDDYSIVLGRGFENVVPGSVSIVADSGFITLSFEIKTEVIPEPASLALLGLGAAGLLARRNRK